MPYTKTNWNDGAPPAISAANLNKMEQGIADATPALVSALPAGPQDGQEIYYLADAVNGVLWHLRYRAGSASSYKWEFVGGSDLNIEHISGQAVTSTAWAEPAGAPRMTLPLAGDYDLTASVYGGTGFGNQATLNFAYEIRNPGGSVFQAPGYDDAVAAMGWNDNWAVPTKKRRKSGLPANAVVVMQHSVNRNSVDSWRREIWARPVRVG